MKNSTMKFLLLVVAFIVVADALPRRYRRSDEQVTYGPCKNTYDQCGDWKTQGMCTMGEYKDYMATVCPVTCDYCKEGASPASTAVADELPKVESAKTESSDALSSSVTSTTPEQSSDQTMTAYQEQLKQYYNSIEKQREDYSAQTEQKSTQPQSTEVQSTETQSTETQSVTINPQSASDTSAATVVPSNSEPAAKQSDQTSFEHAVEPNAASTPVQTIILPQAEAQSPEPSTPAQSVVSNPPPASASPQVSNQASLEVPAQAPVAVAQQAPEAVPQQALPAISQSKESSQPAHVEAPEPDATQSSAPSQATAPVNKPAGSSVGSPAGSPAGPSSAYSQQALDAKPFNPLQTSSALYKNSTATSKDSKNKSLEHKEPDDDATNEKNVTESKHLDSTLAKHLEKSLAKSKQVRLKATKSAEESVGKDESEDDEESEDEEEIEEKEQKHFNKTTSDSENNAVKTFKAKVNTDNNKVSKVKAGNKVSLSSFHYGKSVPAIKLKHKQKLGGKIARSEEPSTADNTKAFETEASLDDSEESGSSSGSGSEGNLNELNLIEGLNFDDDDYDVADDLSNEISNLESQKKFIKNNKEDNIISLPGKNTARSEIEKTSKHQLHEMIRNEKTIDDNEEEEEDESNFTEENSESGESNESGEYGESGTTEDKKDQTLLEITHKNGDLKAFAVTRNQEKYIQPDVYDVDNESSKKSETGSGISAKKSQTSSGDSPSKKSQTGSGDASSKKSQAGSGDAPSKKSQTGSGDAPSKKSQTGSGDAPSKKSQAGSGDAPSKKSHTGSGDPPSKKSHTGSGNDYIKESSSSTDSSAKKSVMLKSEDDNDDAGADSESAEEDTEEENEKQDTAVDRATQPDLNDSSDEKKKKKNHQKIASDFLPEDLLPASEEERKENEEKDFGSGEPEGKISFVLKQNFNDNLKDSKSVNYKMLAGNVKKDVEKILKLAKMNDISFSEATIEGNPRQTGKTKVSFNIESKDPEVYRNLVKLVDAGNINGLSVVKASAESDNDD